MRGKLKLFVTGMFRSGTTLVARMLNVHKNIAFASDPFAPFFKFFRNQIQSISRSAKFDESSPLSDYYFSKSELKLFNSIQNSNFDISLSTTDCLKLIKKIEDHIIPYSPKLISSLPLLDSRSYSKFLKKGMSLVDKVYGDEYSKVIGIKEVWTNEFSPLFIKSTSG